ncbi:DUF6531 domain-containing protein [Saccharopolyspora gregorii]|uniref:DUF6531 domain-containing protein n=1 Tax=Saccharopolyspora gregorii TaxID=33914 RepID=UPI0021AC1FD9|nr:DUF6531 domain-containing protein [Saccharopolyspora gregorii]
MARRPRGGNGDGGGDAPSRPSQRHGNIDASSSVSGAQDSIRQTAQAGRPGGGSGPASTSSTSAPPTSGRPTGPELGGSDVDSPNGTSPAGRNGAPDDSSINGNNRGADRERVPADQKNTCGDPIDIASGDMVLAQTDVELAGVLPLVLHRTHLSSYRVGRHFGPSWSSTLDQRLEVEGNEVSFAADDGTLLFYPLPADDSPVLPRTGPRRALTRTADGFTITDVEQGRTLHFGVGLGRAVLPLLAITDRNGHRIDVDRDAAGTPLEIRHSGGYRIRVDSEDGLITALHLREAADGDDLQLVRYGYTGRRLTEITNASGVPLTFTYDDAGRITSWTDRNGAWYRYGYDHEGRVVQADGSGGFFSGTMSYEDGVTRWTNSLGQQTTYHLNERGQTLREINPAGHEVRSEWDEFDRLLSRTDPLGRTVRYEYDEVGNLLAATRPDGSQTRFEYNELRLPTTVIAPDGTVSRREYDERGNLTRVLDPMGAVTTYAYDEHGHLTAITDALGGVRRVETDAAGLPLSIIDAAGATTRYERDGFGRASAVVDPLGGTTRFGWTVDGKPAWRTLPDGATERWIYDGEGNLRTHVDALGQATHTEVTHFDLPSAEVRPDGTRLEFGYDTELRLTSVTNEQGLVWRYDYDEAGNLVRETDFNGRQVAYRHDAAGQLLERTNGVGETTTFVRNVLGDVIERRTPGATTTFTYDLAGRLAEAMDGDTQIRFQRDATGRVLAESVNGRTVHSAYDALGRRVRRRTPSGAESAWEFNAAHQPTALHAGGRTLRFDYDAAGHETSRALGANAVLTQDWDANHQLLSQHITGATGHQVQQRSYRYRADGLLTGVNDTLTGPRTFELDRAGRVTAVQAGGWTERYTYDAAGNVTDAAWPVPAGSPDADAVGDREYSGTLVRRAGAVRYEHDDQGRMILRQRRRLSHKPDTWRYFWDADDRLTGVLTPDGSRWRYRYDPLGRRVAKQRLGPGDRVLEQVDFTWDGVVLAEQAHSGGVPGGPRFADLHVTVWDYEPGTFRPLAQRERAPLRHAPQQWVDQQFYSIITDLVGSPAELINDQGGVAWFHRTTLWGNTLDHSRTGAYTPLRFPGQYADPETGLNYNFHRHYDPSTGRYGSGDPLGLAAGPRPHGYVFNPQALVDPLGLTAEDSTRWVDPNTINFSQRTISGNDYAELMRQNKWDWNRSDAALHVLEVDGQLVTYDNRRLDAAREVGTPLVPVQQVNPNAPHPDSSKGMTWQEKFEQRFNDRRNKKAGGVVPDTGLRERPAKPGCNK